MTETKFREFLAKGRGLYYIYKQNGMNGLINTWPYEGKFVLTREECNESNTWDEGNFTLDHLFHFPDVDAVIEYLEAIGVDPTHFRL